MPYLATIEQVFESGPDVGRLAVPTSCSSVAEIAPRKAPTFPEFAEYDPRLADSAAIAAVLVWLTELTALVLPMG